MKEPDETYIDKLLSDRPKRDLVRPDSSGRLVTLTKLGRHHTTGLAAHFD